MWSLETERGRRKMGAVHLIQSEPAGLKLKSIFLIFICSMLVTTTTIECEKVKSDVIDKTSISQQQHWQEISETASSHRLPARTKRFVSSDELKIANESSSQEAAHEIIEFRNSDNQIPAASPNFEAAFQGACSKDSHHQGDLCDHICLDLYDGTFECACFYGFALAVDGYSCTRRRAPDTQVAYSAAAAAAATAATTTTTNVATPPSSTTTESNRVDAETTTTDSPTYEVITQGNGASIGALKHLNRATKWTGRRPIHKPSSLISNSSSSPSARRRLAALASSSGHAIRKLARKSATGSNKEVEEAQRQVGSGGGVVVFVVEGNRRHQSGTADLEGQDLPLGGGGGVAELESQDNETVESRDSKRQREGGGAPARQASEKRDGGKGGRRARASAAGRARWKLPPWLRQDSRKFNGDASRSKTEEEDASEDENGEEDDREQQEVAATYNELRHSFVADNDERERKADDLQTNWISHSPPRPPPPPRWTRSDQVDRDEDNSLEQTEQLARASESSAWQWAARGPADGLSKLGPNYQADDQEEGAAGADDDERAQWSFDRSAGAADNLDGHQDSPRGLAGDEQQEGGKESESNEQEEEDDDDDDQRDEKQHQALERDLGLLENLIGKTMADYRRHQAWPKLG